MVRRTNEKSNKTKNQQQQQSQNIFRRRNNQTTNRFEALVNTPTNHIEPITQPQTQTQPQPENVIVSENETPYVSVSRRRRMQPRMQSQAHSQPQPHSSTINSRNSRKNPDEQYKNTTTQSAGNNDVKIDDTTLFPTLDCDEKQSQSQSQTSSNNNNCWKRAGIDVVKTKQKKKPVQIEINANDVRPGWVSISRAGIVYGPHSENYDKVMQTRKRTQAVFYRYIKKRNRQLIMNTIELYGDEYYHVFGDPEKLLNDSDDNGSDTENDDGAASGTEDNISTIKKRQTSTSTSTNAHNNADYDSEDDD